MNNVSRQLDADIRTPLVTRVERPRLAVNLVAKSCWLGKERRRKADILNIGGKANSPAWDS